MLSVLTPQVIEKWNSDFNRSVSYMKIMENLVTKLLGTLKGSGPVASVDSMIHDSLLFAASTYHFKNEFSRHLIIIYLRRL